LAKNLEGHQAIAFGSFFFASTSKKSIARRRKYKVKEEPGGLPTLVAPSKSYTLPHKKLPN
jgi:hypothetical protein